MVIRAVTKKEKSQAERSIRDTVGDRTTVCEHIREIFRIAEERVVNKRVSKQIMEECRIIFAFAKRMNAKLIEYSNGDYEL